MCRQACLHGLVPGVRVCILDQVDWRGAEVGCINKASVVSTATIETVSRCHRTKLLQHQQAEKTLRTIFSAVRRIFNEILAAFAHFQIASRRRGR